MEDFLLKSIKNLLTFPMNTLSPKVFLLFIFPLFVFLFFGTWLFFRGQNEKVEETNQSDTISKKAEAPTPDSSPSSSPGSRLSDTENEENGMVWYTIPEYGIRFLVEREVAERINFTLNSESKKSGTFSVTASPEKSNSPTSSGTNIFATLLEGTKEDSGVDLSSCEGSACCPGYIDDGNETERVSNGVLIFKNSEKRVCYFASESSRKYNEASGMTKKFDPVTKKLFAGYLTSALVEAIR